MIELSSSPPSNSEGHAYLSLSADELRAALQECLTNVQSTGSFAIFEHLSNPINPGLYLKNHGTIGLPLSNGDAAVIVAASHAAPFGKGSETIVDSSVRKTWELSPSDFEIRNPAWQTFLQSVVENVSAGLGVDATGKGVSAELYKMLLYDKGAMFKPHQDSEKAPHMFATLVIALPSKHEGGEVRVSHSGKTEVFHTSKFSEFDSSYLAWFADVTHEVKPVLSGRRLVLTYNLIHTTLGSKDLAANSNIAMSKLRPLLSTWKESVEKDPTLPTTLAFLLEHQYTDASLCYNGLKGHDEQVAAHLREACDEHDFCFYLANLKRTVEGGCDEDDYVEYHEIMDEVDRQTSLKRVVLLDGTEVAKDLEFDEDLFIQEDPFENEAPDDEDYSGYTGNEGVLATHFYNRTVALIVARNHRMEFFLRPNSEKDYGYSSWREPETTENLKVIDWIDRLSSELSVKTNDQALRDDLAQICKMVIRQTQKFKLNPAPAHSWRTPSAPFSDDVIARIMTTTIDLDNEALFLDTYAIYSGKPNASAFQAVGVGLVRFQLDSLLPTIATHLVSTSILSDRIDIIDAVRTGLEKEVQTSTKSDTAYQIWLQAETDLALSSDGVMMVSEKDGTTLANLSKRMPLQDTFNKILPAVKRNVMHTTMAVAFLNGLFNSTLAGEVPQDLAETIFRDIISDLAESFSLSSFSASLAESNKKTAMPGYYLSSGSAAPSPVIDYQNSHNFAVLLCFCQRLGLETELDMIIKKLIMEARTARSDLFHVIYLPFLKTLVKLVHEQNIVVTDSPFAELFQQILSKYIERYVEAEPTPPKDWKRSPVSCQCQDCQQLNRFLANPTEMVGRFAVNQKRRGHLHTVLGITGCTHETDRRGSPQTLVVTKNLVNHLATHKAWAQRRDAAKKHIEDLGTDKLRDFLGKMHGPIMSLSTSQLMRPSQGHGQVSALASSANASNRVLPPITKRKVPSEVIVLDD